MSYSVKLLVTNLVKNVENYTKTDINLNTPYGIVIQQKNTSSGEPELWVANKKSGLVTHYTASGQIMCQTNLLVPSADPTKSQYGSPTGIVYNYTSGFLITKNGITAKAQLIVSTDDGLICGWNQSVDPMNFIIVYNGNALGNSYKGLAIFKNTLYATDFAHNNVNVFNNRFELQNNYPFNYPLVSNYEYIFNCFGISVINDSIFVSYGVDENSSKIKGPGFGIINQFDTNGFFIRRVVNSFITKNETLNSPYGLTWFGEDFAKNSLSSFLTGQEGSGQLQIYDISSGRLNDILKLKNGDIIDINSVRGLATIVVKEVTYVYFVGGDGSRNQGVLGVIEKNVKKC